MQIGLTLVIVGVVVHQFEAMIVKSYGNKNNKGGFFFNAIICLFATIYFFVTDKGGLQFNAAVCTYGVINSIMYATGFYATFLAFKWGSFGLTRLLISFGIIISTFYGIVFLKEPATYLTYLSLAMILLSLSLMNYQKKNDSGQKITLKWIVAVILTIVSNAFITIIGRMQFGEFGDTYTNEFLIISLMGSSIFLFVLGMIFERKYFKNTLKTGLLYGAGAGVCNGINNLIVLVTYNYFPISIASPLKSGLSIVASFLVSLVIYKEKFCKRQIASVIIGIIAVILINLK